MAIDRTFYREIEQELESSVIEADHLIPIRLLELMKPGATVTDAMLKYAGRDFGRSIVPALQPRPLSGTLCQ
jgi:hypothetical protein